jgi:hypothetical protein
MEQGYCHAIDAFSNFSRCMTNHLYTKQLARDQIASEADMEGMCIWILDIVIPES